LVEVAAAAISIELACSSGPDGARLPTRRRGV